MYLQLEWRGICCTWRVCLDLPRGFPHRVTPGSRTGRGQTPIWGRADRAAEPAQLESADLGPKITKNLFYHFWKIAIKYFETTREKWMCLPFFSFRKIFVKIHSDFLKSVKADMCDNILEPSQLRNHIHAKNNTNLVALRHQMATIFV